MAISSLPQLDRFFLTDAGLETDILFNKGIDLPLFSSATLFTSDEGVDALEAYYRGFLDLARTKGTGLILESATWRASPDWAEPLGFSLAELDGLNGAAIELLRGLRAEYADVPIVISGCLGPRGDGYDPGKIMSADEAQAYHAHQAGVLAAAGVDMLAAITMTNVPEAVGVTNAARVLGLPVAISFTVETDGRLPTGDALGDAIAAVDAATGSYPAYYMVNCAHPTHFDAVLDDGAAWTARIGGVRANASCLSHAELDVMTELDIGDPADLAARHRALVERFPRIKVLGGCCGTDLRHVTAIADACII
ncbi:S-methylmethionine-dependent homocysteine/selenocysteine methylase [Sphingopyxis sp. OAS728]|uniref:homocysteine S-methyltransferase family protein n=1 Tax=Sphingopyxis sp. OAS728 TaxID=2663823 RepID=UPI00178BC71A|nr:homocysteine S-methyltransferase family protein [Sphingopyxis sp. OAS728]MBE1527388.1 S-methylmethionine-dependent homocysteine/selenocysteine methylase [Sphingopyxis sp. OAS728]